MKETMWATAQEIVQERKKRPDKANWLTQETINIIEERRRLKIQGRQKTAEYRRLTALIQRMCRKYKAAYLEDFSKQVERHHEQNEMASMFREIKRITGSFKSKTWAIEDENSNLLTDRELITERWKQYCERLYHTTDAKPNRV